MNQWEAGWPTSEIPVPHLRDSLIVAKVGSFSRQRKSDTFNSIPILGILKKISSKVGVFFEAEKTCS
jgi:hypothetical protein